jgi:hypothetical protein
MVRWFHVESEVSVERLKLKVTTRTSLRTTQIRPAFASMPFPVLSGAKQCLRLEKRLKPERSVLAVDTRMLEPAKGRSRFACV